LTVLSVGLAVTAMWVASRAKHRREAFADAVAKARREKVDETGTAADGLPFFITGTMTPVWGEADRERLVRLPDFGFVDQNGRPVQRLETGGKPALVSFMFTSCMGICPTLVQNIKNAQRKLKGVDARYIGISVDPESDVPERLREFYSRMRLDDQWTLLTGDRDRVMSYARHTLGSQIFQRTDTAERNFAHSEHVYFFDRDGYLRAVLNGSRLDFAVSVKAVISRTRQ